MKLIQAFALLQNPGRTSGHEESWTEDKGWGGRLEIAFETLLGVLMLVMCSV